MNVKADKLEKNMAKLTVTVDKEQFEKAVEASYRKNKGRFNIPGFRKGHASRKMIEKTYGTGVFFEDAVNTCIDESYPEAVKESGFDVVSRPEIDVEKVEAGSELVYNASVALRPEVTLGEYKGIEVEKADMSVKDSDIEEAMKKEQENNARLITVEGRPAEEGDIATIDFDGSVDGEAFSGGKGEDYPLSIGSKTFIEGFEEQVIGHVTGDEFDVKVTFPKDYHASDLAGKEAVFKVKLKELKKKELPELNDEFASEISEFETLDAYKADLKKKLEEAKAKAAATENEDHVIEKVVSNASMEVPDPMIDAQVGRLIDDYSRRMQSQGISLDQYMKYTGTTSEKLREQFRPQALKRIQTRLVLEEVVKKENIKVDDAAIESEIEKMAKSYKMELDKLKEYMGDDERKQIGEDLAVQEAIDMIVAESKLI